MYLPSQFTATDTRLILQLMREHSFALLISNDADGLPFTSHLPLNVLEAGNRIWIEGHVAKANMHHKLWAENPKILVVFTGPHAYLSPSVYPDLARVPTWNYLAVQAAYRLGDQNAQALALWMQRLGIAGPD